MSTTRIPPVIRPVTENEDGAPLHFASCADCGARWAGPFDRRTEAADVALGMNDDPWFEVPRRLRSGVCCGGEDEVSEPVTGAAVGINVGSVDDGPRVPLTGILCGAMAVVVFTAWMLWQVCRAVWALGRGMVSLGAWMLPIGIAVIAVVAGLSAALPPVSFGYLDVLAWLGVPALLALVGAVCWRWARPTVPRIERPVEVPEKNLGPIYSTPLRTPQGEGSVSPVSKTPADGSPQGVTG